MSVGQTSTCALTNDDVEDESGGGNNPEEEMGDLTISLEVVNGTGTNLVEDDFTVYVDGEEVEKNPSYVYPEGTYTVHTEYHPASIALAFFHLAFTPAYTVSYTLDCGAEGSVTVTSGSSASCKITISTEDSNTGGGPTGGSPATVPGGSSTPGPEPRVLGVVDELPRTGGSTMPLTFMSMMLLVGLALVRSYERTES